MTTITQRRSLTPPALERLLDRLEEGFGNGFTLYVTPASLGDPVSLVPQGNQEELTEIADKVADSETGAVFFWGQETHHVVLPPFPLQQNEFHPGFAPFPLLRLLRHPYLVGVLLLRLGRYSIGVFRGDTLLASKTDARYVKGRHRAGGSSANRFRRIREKQVQELFGKTCTVAQGVLAPYEDTLEYLLYGGERHVLQAFRKECLYLDRLADRTLQRVLAVHEPRRAELEQMPQEVWKSQVLTIAP